MCGVIGVHWTHHTPQPSIWPGDYICDSAPMHRRLSHEVSTSSPWVPTPGTGICPLREPCGTVRGVRWSVCNIPPHAPGHGTTTRIQPVVVPYLCSDWPRASVQGQKVAKKCTTAPHLGARIGSVAGVWCDWRGLDTPHAPSIHMAR